MSAKNCPKCGEPLIDHSRYLYCYSCSAQYKRKFFGKGLKEVENTLQKDQGRAMGK